MREGSPGSHDSCGPPDIPTEVHCLHCGQEYESYLIKWVPDETSSTGGFWSCPTPGCDGIGFCIDIWPTDPEWRDEYGQKVIFFDDDDEDEEGDFELDDAFEDSETAWQEPEEPGSDNGHPPSDEPLGEEDIPF